MRRFRYRRQLAPMGRHQFIKISSQSVSVSNYFGILPPSKKCQAEMQECQLHQTDDGCTAKNKTKQKKTLNLLAFQI